MVYLNGVYGLQEIAGIWIALSFGGDIYEVCKETPYIWFSMYKSEYI
jgi:hypothetical protein